MGGTTLHSHLSPNVPTPHHQELAVLCPSGCHRNCQWLPAGLQSPHKSYGERILGSLLPSTVSCLQVTNSISSSPLPPSIPLLPPLPFPPLPSPPFPFPFPPLPSSPLLSPPIPSPPLLSHPLPSYPIPSPPLLHSGIEWINQVSFISFATSNPNAAGNVRNELVATNIQTGEHVWSHESHVTGLFACDI